MKRDLLNIFLRDLGTTYRARQMYPRGNEQVTRAAEKAARSLAELGQKVRIARVGEDLLVEDRALTDPPTPLKALMDRLAESGREGLHIDPEADPAELAAWVECVISGEVENWQGRCVRAGSLHLEKAQASAARLSQATAGYLSLMPQVQEALSDLGQEKVDGIGRAKEIVRAIAAQMATGEELVNPIRDLRTHDDYTFTHALNVCVISAAMCRSLGLAKGLVDAVSLAALCHDLGKERVPQEILNKKGTLDPEEKAVMDRHPVEGAALLLGLPDAVDPLLPIVAYQHHLGADGSGYPPQPASRKAHPASLLVAVADVYDALRTVRTYQEPRSAWAACTVMLDQCRRGILHEGYLGVFARLLGVLRPGDRLVLSDDRRGRVLHGPEGYPLRPVVETEGGEVVDLGAAPGVWIRWLEDMAE